MWLRFRLGFLFLLTGAWLALAPGAVASNEFTRSINLNYTVLNSGITNVKYEIRLKNNFSTIFARQYALTVNSTDLENVEVRDADGTHLPFDISAHGNQTSVSVRLDGPGRVIGRDNERLFTISYTSADAAEIYGQVLEVSVPKLAQPDDYAGYNVTINVPSEFGPPSIVEPARYTFDGTDGYGVLRFTNVGQQTGISAIFGDEQTYDVELIYQVENRSQNVGIVQVALPPDTAYQRVHYQSIVPSPEKIRVDADGNWIAEFRVAGQADQQIVTQLQITTLARPQPPLPVSNPQKTGRSMFGSAEVDYLRATTYWQVNNPAIQELAQQYRTPREIYQYTVDALQYNYQRFQQSDATKRLGATGALDDPANAVCLEFADLFIAIARAAGIPARRATGFAVAQNSQLRPLSLVADVLHAWPEYYDTQRNHWVAIDPTWADTTGGIDYFSKLDLRHLTFAIQGQDDELPYPAGMYKIAGQPQKNVQVELATEKVDSFSDLEVTKRPTILPSWGIPTQETFLITNQSGQARYNIDIAIGVEGQVSLLSDNKVHLPVLLPYETYELVVQLSGNTWFSADHAQLNLFIDEQESSYEVSARRSFNHPATRWIFVGAIVATVSVGAGGLLVFGLRRFGPVRR